MTSDFTESNKSGPKDQDPDDRVKRAEAEKLPVLHTLLAYCDCIPGDHVLLRAFKHEKELEVWMKPASRKEYAKVRTYPICAASGHPGPKLVQGDCQVPEGFYHLSAFNPKSKFHLSLRINYPNKSDLFYCNPSEPGGDIYIHGNCMSKGCLAMTNDYIREIYVLCNLARTNGQQKIPVYLLPFRFGTTAQTMVESMYPEFVDRWNNLRCIDRIFEQTHVPSNWDVNEKGDYFPISNP